MTELDRVVKGIRQSVYSGGYGDDGVHLVMEGLSEIFESLTLLGFLPFVEEGEFGYGQILGQSEGIAIPLEDDSLTLALRVRADMGQVLGQARLTSLRQG